MGITFGKDPESEDDRRRLAQGQPRVAIIPAGATDEQAITVINYTIDKMRSYGVIHVSLPKGAKVARFIFWSNAQAGWSSYGQAQDLSVKQGISADANKILVVGSNKAQIDRILPRLAALPLYHGSFEARQRGVFDLTQGEIPPAIKKALADSERSGVPLDEQTRKALEEKFKGN